MTPPPDPADELVRLRRRLRFWTWFTVAAVLFSLWGWFGSPLCRAPVAATAPRTVDPVAPTRHPSYIKAISAAPEGFGFIVSFVLSDAKGNPVRSEGTAVVYIYDEYYGYSGADMDLVFRDSCPVSPGDFVPTTSGTVACFLPRADLTHASISHSSTGVLIKLWFIDGGDTLRTAVRTAWPL